MALPAALATRLRESDWRFVVTGASGWVGMATLELLHAALDEQASSRVLAFGSTTRELLLRNGRRVLQRPMTALEDLAPVPTMLLHYAFLTRDRVAGMSLHDYVAQNRAISEQVECCARSFGTRAALVLSSGAVYAQEGELTCDLNANPYGVLKLEDEARFTCWAEDCGAKLLLPRLFNLSGPYINKLETYALATLIRAAQTDEPMRIRAAHPVVRSYTAVEDLLAVNLWHLAQGARTVVRFDTAGEREVEIGELALEVKRVVGSTLPVVRPPLENTRIDRYVGNGAKYAELLAEAGITPQTLPQQIARTADDLRLRFA